MTDADREEAMVFGGFSMGSEILGGAGDTDASLDSKQVQTDRLQLALAYRLCSRFNLNEGVGNLLSWQVADDRDELLLVRSGLHWSQAKGSDILVVDSQGDVLRGAGKPEITGLFSHQAVHKALGNGGRAVFCTQMPFATTLMALKPAFGGRVLPVHQGYTRFHGWIAYEDIDPDKVADTTASTLTRWKIEHRGKTPRILLSRSQGVFSFGETVAEAWDNMYYLERLCELQVRALSCACGDMSRLQLIPEKAIEALAKRDEGLRQEAVAAHWKGMEKLMSTAFDDDD
jgi:ribulose-5-phosphate 4-epimerase/fuculose-1-phosphate aldolase